METLTIKEAAVESQFAEKTIRKWIAQGKIPSIQDGKGTLVRIPQQDWLKFIKGKKGSSAVRLSVASNHDAKESEAIAVKNGKLLSVMKESTTSATLAACGASSPMPSTQEIDCAS